MTAARLAAVAVALGLLAAAGRAADPPALDPARTWVFAASCSVWKYDPSLNQPQEDRRDLVLIDAFKAWGVPAAQIAFLKDEETTLAGMTNKLRALLKRVPAGDTFVFYYAGHGSRLMDGNKSTYYFVNHDARGEKADTLFTVPHLFDLLAEHFRGGRALLTADCCCSGGLCVEAAKRDAGNVACLASVAAHNSSTGRWTFTNCLIRGLQGDGRADLNGDGALKLGELARYAELELAFLEQQKAMFRPADGLPADTRLGPAKPKPDPAVGKHLEVRTPKGDWRRAEVDAAEAGGKYRVVFPNEGTKVVAADRTRAFTPAAVPDGSKVEAKSEADGKWYPGVVVQSFYGMHHIKFDGYAAAFNEWVPADGVRPRP